MIKKILFIVVLFAGIGFSQYADTNYVSDPDYTGRNRVTKEKNGVREGDNVFDFVNAVKMDSLNAKINLFLKMYQGLYTAPKVNLQAFPNSQTYADVRNSWDWVRYSYGAKDTLNAGTDNLALVWNDSTNFSNVFSNWWGGEIEVDDTVEISSDATFPKGKTIKVLPGRLVPLVKRNIAYLNNIYLRRFVTPGATGTINWNIRFWGF